MAFKKFNKQNMIFVIYYILALQLDYIVGLDIKPHCSEYCLETLHGPVCASNGQTYHGRCILSKAQCRDETITLLYHGPCIYNCGSNPCKNKGKCYGSGLEYSCICQKYYRGTNCQLFTGSNTIKLQFKCTGTTQTKNLIKKAVAYILNHYCINKTCPLAGKTNSETQKYNTFTNPPYENIFPENIIIEKGDYTFEGNTITARISVVISNSNDFWYVFDQKTKDVITENVNVLKTFDITLVSSGKEDKTSSGKNNENSMSSGKIGAIFLCSIIAMFFLIYFIYRNRWKHMLSRNGDNSNGESTDEVNIHVGQMYGTESPIATIYDYKNIDSSIIPPPYTEHSYKDYAPPPPYSVAHQT